MDRGHRGCGRAAGFTSREEGEDQRDKQPATSVAFFSPATVDRRHRGRQLPYPGKDSKTAIRGVSLRKTRSYLTKMR